jgi:hypothetical protein
MAENGDQNIEQDPKKVESAALLSTFGHMKKNMAQMPPVVALRVSLAVNVFLLIWAVSSTIPRGQIMCNRSLSEPSSVGSTLDLNDPAQVCITPSQVVT